jgi:putative ABC transport system permease protein
MNSLLSDVRYGLRLMRRSPVFTAVTIATLALGIGANAAIYSVVDAVLLRRLPYAEPDRIAMVWEDATFAGFARNTPAPANYVDWRDRTRAFAELAATRGATANLTVDGPPEQVLGRRVTANFFTVLGVQPALGRAFTEAEDRAGAQLVVISHNLWRRRYGSNPGVIGAPMMMSGVTRTIVGVMPQGFVFGNRDNEFWSPIQFTPAEIANRNSHFLNVIGRLKPGVTMAQAREDMEAIAAQLAAEYPASNARLGAVVVPIEDQTVGDSRLELIVLMAAAGCVLLIACANLASLLLSRAVARRAEMAVRVALGAGGGRLVRQMLVEGTLLSLAGGALGLALAPIGVSVLGGLVPTGLPALDVSRLDGRLLVFVTLLSVLTGVLFSLFPAMQAIRTSIADALQQGGRSGIGGRRTLTRDALVVAQVAAALVLLVAAGLMLRTLANLRAIDLGLRPDNLLTMRTSLPQAKYQNAAARQAFFVRVLDGVRTIPGVQNAAYVSMPPFLSIGNTNGYTLEGRTLPPGDAGDALMRVGTPDYLSTIGATLLDGRLLERHDEAGPPVIVINETFARMYWTDGSPIGHRVRFGSNQPWRTIVGVVRDVWERGYDLAMKPAAYGVAGQDWGNAWTPEYLVVRAGGQLASLLGPIRQIVADVDPEQPIAAISTMEEILDRNVIDRRHQTTLLSTFAALALLLTAIGLYGVLSYLVTGRRREIGLRIALGASRRSVVRLVVGRGLELTCAGLAIGLALAWVATNALKTLLYGVVANDVGTFAAVLALLALVALCACSVPALRASRVDPMDVLRQE